jgi:polyhydroxyalkanoate synthesis regulator phasin
MLESIKKGFYTGLGLALITKEKAEELAKELVKKGELSEKEGKGFVEEILKKSKEAEQEFEKLPSLNAWLNWKEISKI